MSRFFTRTTRLALVAMTIAAAIITATTLLLAPSDVLAKKNGAKKNAHANGAITAIDTGTSAVTIVNAKKSKTITVTVAETTKLRLDRKKATLAQLAIGDKVKTRYNTQTLVAKQLVAKSPKAQGTVTAVDAGAHTIAIQNGSNTPVTLTVNETTKLKRNGKKATLADFVVGDSVKAKYNAQTLVATKLHAKSK